jgi:hypothetical protein
LASRDSNLHDRPTDVEIAHRLPTLGIQLGDQLRLRE